MSRARNAVIIIILCIIGAYTLKKGPQLALNMPAPETVKDAVAGAPSTFRRGAPKDLTLANGVGEELRDAVAGHAVGTPNNGNTTDSVPPPPRGGGNGGFGAQPNNPGQNFNPPPPNLSPSGPTGGNPTNGGESTPCNEGNGLGAGQGCIHGNRPN